MIWRVGAIEYVGGKFHMYDNPTGVMTNAADFPWQLARLGLYGNLSPNEPPPRKVGDLAIAEPSSGGRLARMPGDFLSASRFVRASMYVDNVPPLPTGLDGMDARGIS